MPMSITSPKFSHGQPIPADYTAEGRDVPPPLQWSGAPATTKSYALLVEDPDAPDPRAPQRVFTHWMVYNLPADLDGLPEDAGQLPSGALPGKNDWGKAVYGGPNPPVGRHRYFFRLFALDKFLPDLANPTKADLLRAMEGHILERAELIGTYQKHAGKKSKAA